MTHADPLEIGRVLDVGGMGVIAQMVCTAADVKTIASATRYPPDGSRSFGPLRASSYGDDYDGYLNRANDNIVTAIIVETWEAIENIDEITAVSGLDVMFLGLHDLCLSYGLNPNRMPFREIDERVEQVLTAGRKHGVAVGTGVDSGDDLRKRCE